MAFCGKCGNQLNEGAKFCPKCGQPTVDAGEVQNTETNNSYSDEPEDEQIKTWQKIVAVLFWPAGAGLTIVAFFKKQTDLAKSTLIYTIIGFGVAIALNAALRGCRSNSGNIMEEIESVASDDEYDDAAEVGYNDGYQLGFTMGIDSDDDSGEPSVVYGMKYGAPSTAEEREAYQVYEKAFKKGYADGKKAQK